MGGGGAPSQEELYCSLHDPPASYAYRVDHPRKWLQAADGMRCICCVTFGWLLRCQPGCQDYFAQPFSRIVLFAAAEEYNWCIVPNSSYDVTLFGALAVILACLLQGRLSSLFVLLAGKRSSRAAEQGSYPHSSPS
jgi:hypothetical protein